MKKPISVKLDETLLAQLKTTATSEGTTVTALLEMGARLIIGSPKGRRAVATMKPGATPRDEFNAFTQGHYDAVQRGIADAIDPIVLDPPILAPSTSGAPEPICRRCQHRKGSHWSGGCLAGCTCTVARMRLT